MVTLLFTDIEGGIGLWDGRGPCAPSGCWCCAWPGRILPGAYRRVHGELLTLGIKVAASTVWEILRQAGINPAPERTSTTWASFLRSQANALLACDFFETVTLTGTRHFVANARPLQDLPPPISRPDDDTALHIRRHDRLGGILHEYQHAA
jgi:hypothetical protein